MNRKIQNETTALMILNMLCLTAMMAFIPVVGPVVRKLQMSEWHGGLVVTVAGVLWMFMARYWGRLSDRLGRKKVLLRAASGYTVSFFLMAIILDVMLAEPPPLWVSLAALLILRGSVGAFYAALPSVSAARIADITEPKKRPSAMAKLGVANGVGMVAGPAIGGLLVQDSLILPLYAAIMLPLFGIVWLIKKVPTDKEHVATTSPPLALKDKRLRLPLWAIFLAMSSVLTAQMIVGFYTMDIIHLDAHDAARVAGIAMATVGVVLILVQAGLSKMKELNPRWCIAVGAFIGSLGFILLTVSSGVFGLITCYAIIAFGMAFVFPSVQALAANRVSDKEQGIAAGSVAAVQGLSMVITPLICTLAYEIKPQIPYLMAAIALIILTLITMLQKENKDKVKPISYSS
ncbi:MFS transporter [Marinomonas rhizomae]|uniref:Putative MFS family arabinose efflux permease n=1 Tax=Marinomonas rhizomae TaxID=491948 RepID=A0A366JAL3_9GAMM|nr:MFS transporter [Marinomonas rhizomae]RBP83440.1 putative MFS family arabinose efflux permease [Marinomonas rhizomae]